jgi:hypothetical protein
VLAVGLRVLGTIEGLVRWKGEGKRELLIRDVCHRKEIMKKSL